MKRKAAKKLLAGLSGTFSDLQAGKVETAKFEDKELYLFDESIEFVKDENGIYPFLGGSYLDSIPKVVVDMGAIRFVCNGADVMAPGITEIGSFDEGDLVVIRDINHGKALAIGIANKSSADIEASKKGKVIKNLHYVGDKLWGAVS
jgi:PUA-domain protein